MIVVTIVWNTEADGSDVPDGTAWEDYPRCHYGPFESYAAAIHWMEEEYPDGDMDVLEMWAADIEPPLYINHPSIIHGGENT